MQKQQKEYTVFDGKIENVLIILPFHKIRQFFISGVQVVFLAIVIPCFNEANRIDCSKFSTFIAEHPEIVFCFVDDGSSDNTGEVLEKIAGDSTSDVLKLEQNCGKAEAVRQGLLHVCKKYPSIEYAGFWDADLATPLDEIFDFCNCFQKDTLMVIGCRHARLGTDIRRKSSRHYLGRIFATAASIHLKLPVYDTQCGAKIMRKHLVQELFDRKFVTRWFFDVEILRRCIENYGAKEVRKRVVEKTLKKWTDTGNSKLKLFHAAWDFLKLLCSKN